MEKLAANESRLAKVFVVDDEAVSLDIYTKILRKNGYFTLAASCAADALETIDRGLTKADVILTDINMPELDGFALYQLVQKRHPGLEKKIIFMTGGIFNEELKKFSETIPNIKLKKPFEIEELLRAITQVLGPSGEG
jgi:CheY-like chemotaxis protein